MYRFVNRAFQRGKKQIRNGMRYHWDRLKHGFEGVTPDLKLDGRYSENGVFIIGSGKSGTTLMQALFDSHPNMLIFPVESGYYANFDKILQHKKSKRKIMQFLMYESKFSWMREKLYLRHPVEEYRNFSRVDFEQFQRTLLGYDMKKHSRKTLYLYLLEAYRLSLGLSKNALFGFVDKTPLHVFYVDQIQEDFPEARFIHVLRDPFDNYDAYRTNFLADNPNSKIEPILQRHLDKYIYPSFLIADENRKKENYRIVRYEDVVLDPEKEMKSLAAWIGVPYSDTLVQVTLCGQSWPGNSSSGNRMHGISKERMGKGKNNITRAEVNYIEAKLGDLGRSFGYFHEEGEGRSNGPQDTTTQVSAENRNQQERLSSSQDG